MKWARLIVLAAAVPVWAPGFAVEARAGHVEAVGFEVRDVSDFYEPLAAFGHWVNVAPYGWCWSPARVGSDWRPYANGHWLWTDGGWYWVSDEPWAWACYHYGRWFWHPRYGWLWVPGLQWAPAWVVWRQGGDCIGWAPLPPDCDFVHDARAFVFVERRRFCEPIRPAILIVNRTVIFNTVIVKHPDIIKHPDIDAGEKPRPCPVKVRPPALQRQLPVTRCDLPGPQRLQPSAPERQLPVMKCDLPRTQRVEPTGRDTRPARAIAETRQRREPAASDAREMKASKRAAKDDAKPCKRDRGSELPVRAGGLLARH